jgi:hypothetical protein
MDEKTALFYNAMLETLQNKVRGRSGVVFEVWQFLNMLPSRHPKTRKFDVSERDAMEHMERDGYIEITGKDPNVAFGNYHVKLTPKGIRFLTEGGYVKELKDLKRKQREWSPFWRGAIISLSGAALSLLVGYILWRIDNRSKLQESQEIIEQLQKANNRIDSIKSLPVFQVKNLPANNN